MLQELNNFINIFKNFWGNQLNSLFSHLFVKGGGAQDLSDHLQKCTGGMQEIRIPVFQNDEYIF